MKRYRVLFRETAKADLRSIFDYVRDRSGSRETAFRYTRRVRRRCEKIGEAPLGGAPRPEFGMNIRMIAFERSIVVLYAVVEGRVEITNLIAGGRDYETLLLHSD
jgi:toxin ParE1/3/4